MKKIAISLIRGLGLKSYEMISEFTKLGLLDFHPRYVRGDWESPDSAVWKKYSTMRLMRLYMKYKG